MSTPPRGIATVIKALAALSILTVLLVGVPVLLIVLGAYPHTVATGSQVVATLTQRDTGPLLQAVLTLLVWLTWALFALATIREGLAAVRSRGAAVASPFTGLGAVSVPAAYLVHTALALFVVSPVLLTATATATVADVTPPPPSPSVTAATATGVRPSATPTDTASTTPATALLDQAPTGPTVTVRRHDTLWRLAELHLDDPRRWTEIRTLNQGLLHGGTTLIPGQQLHLPADARLTDTRLTDTAVVERGDTIWQIAADHDVPAQAVIDANLGRPQPGGDHLNDPDHIEPGWTLVIPRGLQPHTPPAHRDRAPHEQPPSASTPSTAPTPSPGTAAPSAPGSGTPWTPAGGWPTGSGR
ncbi:MAG: LysM peptidoglycan-binding domain-containing protein, partial [Kineosporiaceae bacterium]